MPIEFQVKPDYRTAECRHDQLNGCHLCCPYCDIDNHHCGGCGEPMKHYSCSGARLGTCNDCRDYYFNDHHLICADCGATYVGQPNACPHCCYDAGGGR